MLTQIRKSGRGLFVPALAALVLSGCGGGDDNDTPRGDETTVVTEPAPSPTPSPSPTPAPGEPPITPVVQVSLQGRLVAPDGATPLVNATVYLPATETVRRIQPRAVVGVDCETPAVEYQVAACTDGEGRFSLTVTEGLVAELMAIKGAFTSRISIDTRNMAAEATVDVGVMQAATEGDDATRMAVVTGEYDLIEDVLAKSGFGQIDEQGRLVPGTEAFDRFDGGTDPTLPGFAQLFVDRGDGLPRLHDYDIVFINCGVNEYNDVNGSDPGDAAVTAALQTYVEAGGRLYLTDQAYDYLEQAFPGYIDFNGDDGLATSLPETQNGGQVGNGGITVPAATVDDSHLLAFLSNVTCEAGANCLNEDNTLALEGFVSGWTVMDGAHDNGAAPVTFYVSGQVSTAYETDVVKPLTAAFTLGAGKVFFSSYHTEDRGSVYFLPQERVLQYLVFE